MGASIGKGVIIEANAVVAAGSVVEDDTRIPSHQIWAGDKAKYLRDITNEERESLNEFMDEMKSLAEVHFDETNKTTREIINDLDKVEAEDYMKPTEFAIAKLREMGFPVDEEDQDLIEQRIIMREYEQTEEADMKNYDPYTQDLYHFPDHLKVYQENYSQYDELKQYFEENPSVVA
mmetsp:Transcript_40300/g.35804  ORF Transcript_40300/g.35804 Transcript_40300/m.35804 type:complete len:177 (+) Transcript_40300:509-1039(+)|eukprot:CAMPEP_0114582568 /NCGR_PEP_ID=MMETSP0125-20121206/6518_1 /TAXON_ID=485358 ORGANISM="Aristerostoma sp., Strain ATCC 50986" /NCGR_SAMPLE_ID=MMETSP0125 /ASSEMBLY_ACC=CAM_ASM_000245 /LENGTH=176 /DNA_ID=CAMNT_0001775589 /DNA_START=485 /DNA_END=1015 /DNA_ORIENTATION=+